MKIYYRFLVVLQYTVHQVDLERIALFLVVDIQNPRNIDRILVDGIPMNIDHHSLMARQQASM